MKKYELLAPVGDFRSLRAAIDGGADARKALLFEVVGGRSLVLVGGRFEMGQRGCQLFRLGQFTGGSYEK